MGRGGGFTRTSSTLAIVSRIDRNASFTCEKNVESRAHPSATRSSLAFEALGLAGHPRDANENAPLPASFARVSRARTVGTLVNNRSHENLPPPSSITRAVARAHSSESSRAIAASASACVVLDANSAAYSAPRRENGVMMENLCFKAFTTSSSSAVAHRWLGHGSASARSRARARLAISLDRTNAGGSSRRARDARASTSLEGAFERRENFSTEPPPRGRRDFSRETRSAEGNRGTREDRAVRDDSRRVS